MKLRWNALALVLFVGAALAGCAGPEATTGASGAEVSEERPEPTFNAIATEALGSVAPPDRSATLDDAPRLVPGEWWRIRLHSSTLDEEVELVRVVAKVEDDGSYVFGMPHEGWWKEAMIIHTPAFGDVGADLSHRAHDVPFVPLQFPLEDGKTWTTHWENADVPLTATVSVVDDTTADIVFTRAACAPGSAVLGCNDTGATTTVLELRYDAAVHEVVSFRKPTAVWEVIEHGYGYEGWVTVPRGEHLVFYNGRIATPLTGLTLEPSVPTETVTVAGGYNRVSFILGAGNLAPGTGVYRERAVAPDGQEFVVENIPGGSFRVEFFEHAAPEGDWQLEHLVAGPGYAFIEGIAYHQYDIHLPSSAIRSDHSHQVIR